MLFLHLLSGHANGNEVHSNIYPGVSTIMIKAILNPLDSLIYIRVCYEACLFRGRRENQAAVHRFPVVGEGRWHVKCEAVLGCASYVRRGCRALQPPTLSNYLVQFTF